MHLQAPRAHVFTGYLGAGTTMPPLHWLTHAQVPCIAMSVNGFGKQAEAGEPLTPWTSTRPWPSGSLASDTLQGDSP